MQSISDASDQQTLGENYFSPVEKKWKAVSLDGDGNRLRRGFDQYVLEPVYKILKGGDGMDALVAMSGKLGFHFKVKENEAGVPLSRLFMKKWLPASDALLELIVFVYIVGLFMDII